MAWLGVYMDCTACLLLLISSVLTHPLIHLLFYSCTDQSTPNSSPSPHHSNHDTMRFFLPLFLFSLSAFAAPSTSTSSSEVTGANSTLESRTFFCPSGTNWKLTKCCPYDAIEKHFQCVCSKSGETLSADGRRCESRCSQSEWKWCSTQCCPPGSDEVHGQCKVSPLV